MIFRVADNRDPASVCRHGVPFRHGVDRVVSTFAVHIRLQQRQQRSNRGLGKNDHVVDAAEGGDELRAITRGQYGPARPLPPRRGIVIDRHDEAIGLGSGGLQVADVPHVKKVEAAVCEGYRSAGASFGRDDRDELLPVDDFLNQDR